MYEYESHQIAAALLAKGRRLWGSAWSPTGSQVISSDRVTVPGNIRPVTITLEDMGGVS
jgi:hypothetical protein